MTTRFEGYVLTNELESLDADGNAARYTGVWRFTDADRYDWTLYVETAEGRKQTMAATAVRQSTEKDRRPAGGSEGTEARPIPEGFHTVSPHLVIKNAAAAIEFYQRAFCAEETERMTTPEGQGVMHAEIRIGDSMVMIGEEYPDYGVLGPESIGGSTVTIHLYTDDSDASTSGRSTPARPRRRRSRTSSGAIATARSRTPSATCGRSPPISRTRPHRRSSRPRRLSSRRTVEGSCRSASEPEL